LDGSICKPQVNVNNLKANGLSAPGNARQRLWHATSKRLLSVTVLIKRVIKHEISLFSGRLLEPLRNQSLRFVCPQLRRVELSLMIERYHHGSAIRSTANMARHCAHNKLERNRVRRNYFRI
jgi:hypothetical protein